MDILLNQTVVFAFLLALALLIERFLEVLKSVYDYIDLRMGLDAYWTKRAQALQEKIEANIKALEKGHHERIAALVRQFGDKIIGSNDNGVITVSGDLMRATMVRFTAKLIAITTGIGLALCFHLDLVSIWQAAVGDNSPISGYRLGTLPKELLTGVALGLGSAPMHKIITTIERQQKKRQAKNTGGPAR
jgi:hypothetical protein